MDLEVQPQGKQAPLQEELGYLIGPGDVLIIEVWKYPDVSRDVVVNEEGDIRLPMIKSIRAMGMTVPQLEKKLTQALSQYLVDPSVFVTIKDYNSQRVIAMGEVKAGMYTLKRKTTLTEFLSQIGGPTDKADITRLKLIKKDGKTISYDLNELLKDPQKAEAVLVSGGDTFYVPPLETKKVYVFGQVATQKAIDIKGKYKLVDAIADAGGPTARAITKSIVVVRNAIGSPKAILIDLDKILKKADLFQNIELMPGDIIYVPRSFIADIETFWALITPPMWLLAIFGPIMGIFK
jgi:polysaccharide export outer membrane protein